MSIEALWSLEFKSNLGNYGGGVVILERNRILGGGSAFYYVGRYELDGQNVTFNVTVAKYDRMAESIFGDLSKFALTLDGQFNEPKMILSGQVDGNPLAAMTLIATKRAELP